MSTWTSPDGLATIHCGDALEVLRGIPDASIALVATDPPYFKMKDRELCDWDYAWDTAPQYLEWLGRVLDEFRRVLKPNGSLYLFASEEMAWHVEGEVRRRLNLVNRIVWAKHDGSYNRGGLWSRQCKEELRSYFPQTEYLFFAEQPNSDSMALGESGYASQCEKLHGFVFDPLRRYLADEFAALGWNGDKLNEICGTASMAGRHYTARSQWCLPTEEHYAKLQHAAQGAHLRREYEDLRRKFTVTATDQYTDVWDFPTVGTYPGKHPCEKPADMIRQIIRTSSRAGDAVLDCFAGSGVTGQVALELGRRVILCDQDEHWYRQAIRRTQGRAPERPKINKPLPLFDSALDCSL